jgi:predicted RNA-binding Zn-ribbon protein involved in translation (DUF1610 family)
MSLDRVQCPSCGGHVSPEGRDAFHCSYCGAKLVVRRGASGNLMADLETIRQDTALLARQTAEQHLRKQLKDRLADLARVKQRCEAERSAVNRDWSISPTANVLIAAGFLALLIVVFSHDSPTQAAGLVVGTVLCAVGGIVGWGPRQAKKKAVDELYAPQIRQCEERVEETRRRLAEVGGEIDKLVDQM